MWKGNTNSLLKMLSDLKIQENVISYKTSAWKDVERDSSFISTFACGHAKIRSAFHFTFCVRKLSWHLSASMEGTEPVFSARVPFWSFFFVSWQTDPCHASAESTWRDTWRKTEWNERDRFGQGTKVLPHQTRCLCFPACSAFWVLHQRSPVGNGFLHWRSNSFSQSRTCFRTEHGNTVLAQNSFPRVWWWTNSETSVTRVRFSLSHRGGSKAAQSVRVNYSSALPPAEIPELWGSCPRSSCWFGLNVGLGGFSLSTHRKSEVFFTCPGSCVLQANTHIMGGSSSYVRAPNYSAKTQAHDWPRNSCCSL